MKGTYVLLIELSEGRRIKIGGLGIIQFKDGAYAYVGSALKNLEKRIGRHMRENKKIHWHIDYFLEEAEIVDVIYSDRERRKECEIARNISENTLKIDRFGSSDCKCESHLFYGELSEMEIITIDSFREAGEEPKRWDNG